MTWQQAFAATGDPRKYRPIQLRKQRIGGQEMDMLVSGPQLPFSLEGLETRIADGSLPHGFIATFNFSAQAAFTVTFDRAGAVQHVEDAATVADLLQTRED